MTLNGWNELLPIRGLALTLMVAFIGLLPFSAEAQTRTVLITGANQGHGLAFANDYAERGWNVIATCRTPDKAERLTALADQYSNITIEELDVTDFGEIDALADKCLELEWRDQHVELWPQSIRQNRL